MAFSENLNFSDACHSQQTLWKQQINWKLKEGCELVTYFVKDSLAAEWVTKNEGLQNAITFSSAMLLPTTIITANKVYNAITQKINKDWSPKMFKNNRKNSNLYSTTHSN